MQNLIERLSTASLEMIAANGGASEYELRCAIVARAEIERRRKSETARKAGRDAVRAQALADYAEGFDASPEYIAEPRLYYAYREAQQACRATAKRDRATVHACMFCGEDEAALRVYAYAYVRGAGDDLICEECFTGSDTGPCFDDLPEILKF